MSKKRKRISRRRLAGQRVLAHVPIFHLETGEFKPVTAARRYIAEAGLSSPSILNVRRNEHTTDRFFWGEKGLFSAQYAEENSINKDTCVYGDIFAKEFLVKKNFTCFKTYSQLDAAKEKTLFAYKNLRNVKRSDPKDCQLIWNETYNYSFYSKKIILQV